MRLLRILALAAVGALPSGAAFGQGDGACGELYGQGFGPFDYRTAPTKTKQMVEPVHFTTDVERLRAGSTGTIAADINYTLIVFPNHPRALLSMSRLMLRTKEGRPKGARYSMGCYFDRAIRFAPDDQLVRLVYAIHLIASGQKNEARVQLEFAEANPLDEPNFHYNLGLSFLDVGDADRALKHAWQAYAMGYELTGLRNRLEKLGKWREPEK